MGKGHGGEGGEGNVKGHDDKIRTEPTSPSGITTSICGQALGSNGSPCMPCRNILADSTTRPPPAERVKADWARWGYLARTSLPLFHALLSVPHTSKLKALSLAIKRRGNAPDATHDSRPGSVSSPKSQSSMLKSALRRNAVSALRVGTVALASLSRVSLRRSPAPSVG